MENMPYRRSELEGQDVRFQPTVVQPTVNQTVSTDWRDRLPMLAGSTVTLRELRASDAPSLFALLTTEEVSRFISPPPSSVEGFERFIQWTHRQRAAGVRQLPRVKHPGGDESHRRHRRRDEAAVEIRQHDAGGGSGQKDE